MGAASYETSRGTRYIKAVNGVCPAHEAERIQGYVALDTETAEPMGLETTLAQLAVRFPAAITGYMEELNALGGHFTLADIVWRTLPEMHSEDLQYDGKTVQAVKVSARFCFEKAA